MFQHIIEYRFQNISLCIEYACNIVNQWSICRFFSFRISIRSHIHKSTTAYNSPTTTSQSVVALRIQFVKCRSFNSEQRQEKKREENRLKCAHNLNRNE